MKTTLALALVLLVGSCTSSTASEQVAAQEEQQDALWDSVMQLHDEVMPEMTAINRLSGRLENILSDSTTTPDTRQTVEAALDDLKNSGDMMWEWMAELPRLVQLRRDSLSHEQIMQTLQREKDEISEVSQAMRSSISRAQELLDLQRAAVQTKNQDQ